MRYDPWKDAAVRYAGIHIQKVRLAPMRGAWVPSQRVILVARHLTIAETRHTLAHEIAHIDLGHRQCAGPDAGRLAVRNEHAAEDLAARRLVNMTDLLDVISWTDQHDEVCEMLGITTEILTARLVALTPDERMSIRHAVEQRMDAA